MRIIAGNLKGRTLAAVGKGDVDAHLRPTQDRVRESIFNVLLGGSFGDPISEARVLDLFAGTGALGLEALSRGATHVTFVDNGNRAQDLIRQNIALTSTGAVTALMRLDATRLGECRGEAYDLVFLDPPYGSGLGEKALIAAAAGGWLAPGALLVWEENTAPVTPPGFVLIDQRKYGDTLVTFAEPCQ